MLASAVPTSFPIPFGNSAGAGYINAIPTASQISITPGAASLTDGFPPLNFVDPSAGGVPFAGKDVNGILKAVTQATQWLQAGGAPIYNSTFSTAIGGYPNGAVLAMSSGGGFWISTADNNTTNPDASGAGWKVLSRSAGAYLSVSVAGAVNVTLTAVQSANNIINMTGAITASIAVIVPTVAGDWVFSNNTTGAYTVTVKTSAGTGIVVVQGSSMILYCDGTNVLAADSGRAALAGSSSQAFSAANGATGNQVVNISQFPLTFGTTLLNCTLPNGMIFKVGQVSSVAFAAFTVTFPVAFPTACVYANYILSANTGAGEANDTLTGITASNFSGYNWNGVTANLYWFAIGY